MIVWTAVKVTSETDCELVIALKNDWACEWELFLRKAVEKF